MSEAEKPTCCLMRRKVVVGLLGINTKAQCGVDDSELVDYVLHDAPRLPSNKPIVAFKFCPWCGQKRDGFEQNVVDIVRVEE